MDPGELEIWARPVTETNAGGSGAPAPPRRRRGSREPKVQADRSQLPVLEIRLGIKLQHWGCNVTLEECQNSGARRCPQHKRLGEGETRSGTANERAPRARARW